MKKRLKKLIVVFILTGIVLTSVFAFLLYNGFIWFNNPSIEKYPVRGIDISNHQGEIDWEKLKNNNFSFVFIKATEGKDYIDKYFEANWKNAKNAGMRRGAYHFFTFRSSGKEQAENFIQTVPKEGHSLPPVIDIEFGGNSKEVPEKEAFQKELNDFIMAMENTFGQKPILYVTHDSYEKYISGAYQDYKIWMRDVIKFPNLKDNREWFMWQYCNRGRVDGIKGFTDLNVFKGTKVEFENFISDTSGNKASLNTDESFIEFVKEADLRLFNVYFIRNLKYLKDKGLKVADIEINAKEDLEKFLSDYFNKDFIEGLWKAGSANMPKLQFGFYTEANDLGTLEANNFSVVRYSQDQVRVICKIEDSFDKRTNLRESLLLKTNNRWLINRIIYSNTNTQP